MKKLILAGVIALIAFCIYQEVKIHKESRPYIIEKGEKIYYQGPLLEDGRFYSNTVFINGQGYSVAPEFQEEFINNYAN